MTLIILLKKMKIFSLLLFYLLASIGEAHRILAVLPFPARSHQIFNHGIIKTLAKAGHDVTVLAPISFWDNPTPNYYFIKLNSSLSSLGKMNFFHLNSIPTPVLIQAIWAFGEEMCDISLSNPILKPFMKAKGKYDVLIVEAFANECFMGFAHSLDIPLIQIVTYIGSSWISDSVGAPSPFSYVYEPYMDVEPQMTFFDRLRNTLFGIGVKIARNWIYIPKMDKLMRKNFEDPEMPSIAELETRTSLLLINNHESFSYAKPGMPNMVNVAGMHIEDSKPLPANLQKYMDEAKDGVIFVSMGSVIKMKQMNPEKREAFIKILSKLKQRVIWRWDEDLAIPKEPKNILFSSWLPQVDILAHPNLVAFGTHGGLMSTIEALDKGVPVIGFPIFADQVINMRRFQAKGIGLVLEYKNFTEISLDWAFKEILKPKYLETAKRYSKIFHDRERTAKESTVWWVEYIIRHQGAKHLRSPAMDLLWFQYYLLDILCFILVVFGFIYFVLKLLIKLVLVSIRTNGKVKKN